MCKSVDFKDRNLGCILFRILISNTSTFLMINNQRCLLYYCITNNFINNNEMCFILKTDGRKNSLME